MGFGLLFTLLRKNWQWVLLALALAGVYFYWHGLVSTIDKQQKQIVHLSEENASQKTQIAQLRNSIDTQNAAIDAMVKKGKDLQARLSKATTDAANARKTSDADVLKILQGEKPKTCEAAIQYLIDGVKDLQWQK